MKYRQAALAFLAGNSLEVLIAALVLPPSSLRAEATPLLVGLGFMVLFALLVFNGPSWGSGHPLLLRTVQVLVFVLGANALLRSVLFALSLIPGEVTLVVHVQRWTGTPLLVTGPAGLPAAVKAIVEVGMAYAMGRALWDWPPGAKEAKGAVGKRKAVSRHSSSRA
ncbi:MAG: hypothetical protein HY330_05370 [Chloroflexi bacterium]|nr:hypothetical protein [Chloroflexota bacterium]